LSATTGGSLGSPARSYGGQATQSQGFSLSPYLIRADITYLRQDFSLLQDVRESEIVTQNRFDFLVRMRPANAKEEAQSQAGSAPTAYPQREAVLWALRELTGKDAGSKTEDWVKLFPRAALNAEAEQLTAKLVKSKGAKQTELVNHFRDQEGVI